MEEKKYYITKMIFQKKNILLQYQVGEEKKEISLFPTVYLHTYLYEGKEILEKEWQEIMKMNDLAGDFEFAYRSVAKKSYTIAQLSKKMQEHGISLSHIHTIIQTLKEQNLLDDDRYMTDYIEIMETKHYGEKRIREELKKAGIAQEKIASLTFEPEKEYEKIQALLAIFLKKKTNESNARRKMRLEMELYRYGFSKEIIGQAMQHISLLSEEEERKNCLLDRLKYERIYARQEKSERKRRMIASLMRKGYSYDIIKQVMEENEDELD